MENNSYSLNRRFLTYKMVDWTYFYSLLNFSLVWQSNFVTLTAMRKKNDSIGDKVNPRFLYLLLIDIIKIAKVKLTCSSIVQNHRIKQKQIIQISYKNSWEGSMYSHEPLLYGAALYFSWLDRFPFLMVSVSKSKLSLLL